jgi:predicted metal-dependent hydrolase
MAWLRFSKPEPPRSPESARPFPLGDGASIAIRWVRDRRARRLRLIVGPTGVRLTLPVRASERLAEDFLAKHRDWLSAQLAKRPAMAALPFSRATDTTVLLRGQRLDIEWREGRFARVELSEHGIRVSVSAKNDDRHARAALREFYCQQARADLGRWLPTYLPALPRTPSTIRLRPLSSLWGSLSPRNALSLDLALVLGRPSAFEYVLVHELCHLIHRNHSPRFWREVEARCPEWRCEREYLQGDGLSLKAEMRRLGRQ